MGPARVAQPLTERGDPDANESLRVDPGDVARLPWMMVAPERARMPPGWITTLPLIVPIDPAVMTMPVGTLTLPAMM
jgi:hypothetical protein